MVPSLPGYTIVRSVGQGGMAELFLADRTAGRGLSRRVVLKRVLPELARDAQFREAFVHEARIALQLDHGHIVRVYDFFEADGTYLLEMEFVDGCDLRRLIREGGPLPTELALHVVGSVLRALDYAHRLRGSDGAPLELVHRDVSPANILVSREGEVKLTDFGLARSRERLGQSHGGVKGTFAFMSPEQAEGRNLDARSDLFAAAAVLYACLAGESPFEGDGPVATLDRVRAASYPTLSERLGSDQLELDTLLERALAREPSARFADANALREALESFARETGLRPGPDALAERVRALAPIVQPMPAPSPPTPAVEAPLVTPRLAGVTRALEPPRRARPRRLLAVIGALIVATIAVVLLRPKRVAHIVQRPVEIATPVPVAAPVSAAVVAPSAIPLTPPPRAKPTLITISSDPWAYVDIDGKRRGTTPLIGIAITPGNHEVVLANPPLGISKRDVVHVRAGEHKRLIERLAREN